jgi:hypothetical protein
MNSRHIRLQDADRVNGVNGFNVEDLRHCSGSGNDRLAEGPRCHRWPSLIDIASCREYAVLLAAIPIARFEMSGKWNMQMPTKSPEAHPTLHTSHI